VADVDALTAYYFFIPHSNTVTPSLETHHHYGVSRVLDFSFFFFPFISSGYISLGVVYLAGYPFQPSCLTQTPYLYARYQPTNVILIIDSLRFGFFSRTHRNHILSTIAILVRSSRTHCQTTTQLISLQYSCQSSDSHTAAYQGSRHRLYQHSSILVITLVGHLLRRALSYSSYSRLTKQCVSPELACSQVLTRPLL